MLIVAEQTGLRPTFDPLRILDHVGVWEYPEPSREATARALREIFPESLVTVGGHHVAAHNPITGNRMLMIVGEGEDWS